MGFCKLAARWLIVACANSNKKPALEVLTRKAGSQESIALYGHICSQNVARKFRGDRVGLVVEHLITGSFTCPLACYKPRCARSPLAPVVSERAVEPAVSPQTAVTIGDRACLAVAVFLAASLFFLLPCGKRHLRLWSQRTAHKQLTHDAQTR